MSKFSSEQVVHSKKVLLGPGGVYCLNGLDEGVKPEFLENSVS